MPASSQSQSTTQTPVERHRAALDRRRIRLDRARTSNGKPEVIAAHEMAIRRLSGLVERAVERAATEAEHAAYEAHLARKEAAEDARALDLCGKVLDRMEARGKASIARRPPETAATRRAARAAERKPLTGRMLETDEQVRLIDDPFESGTEIFVRQNRRVDVLEIEKAHGRITEQQFCLGRLVQAVFERASGRLGSGGWNAGSRVDAVTANELRMIYAVDDARIVRAYVDRITRAIGHIDMRILRQVLGERKSFTEIAALRGRAGRQGTAYYADRFRDALAELVEAWAARGVAKYDDEGQRVITGERAEATGLETDERGIVVPSRHGHRWGIDVLRYGSEMNDEAAELAAESDPLVSRMRSAER